jgi:hypothetical protein
VFNVAVFNWGDENSLEALMQSRFIDKTGHSRHEGHARWVLSDEQQ